MNSRVVIVQNYVPHYRVPFFRGLTQRLAKIDIDCVIAAGQPTGSLALRNDASDFEVERVPQRSLRLGNRAIDLSVATLTWRNSDAVIVPSQGTSLNTNIALLQKRFGAGRKVGVWGHLRNYVSPGHPLDLLIEREQLRRADHVFAYTNGGADYASDVGIERSKITVVNNAVDTTALRAAMSAVHEADIASWSKRYDLTAGKTFSFVGGLDPSKRIEFLSVALDHLWKLDPEVRILVGGSGTDLPKLATALRRGQIAILGHIGVEEKAVMGRISNGIVMPGRVGLIAVEALAMERPLLTTSWPWHAPEYEYLTEGVTMHSSAEGNPKDFAELIVSQVGLSTRNPSYKGLVELPTIEDMVERYASGVEKLLS